MQKKFDEKINAKLYYVLCRLQNSSTNSLYIDYCSKCCVCCFYVIEKFIKFINYNAYTIVNIEGTPFCKSAQKAFAIIVENSVHLAAINSVGDFMLFLVKITIAALTLIIAILWLQIPFTNV